MSPSFVLLGRAERGITSEVGAIDCIIVRTLNDTYSPSDSQMQQNSFAAALEILRNAADDLGKLVQCFCDFIEWWAKAETMLLQTEPDDNQTPSPIQNDAVRKGWEDVKTKYLQYRISVSRYQSPPRSDSKIFCVQISTLKDFYPSDRRPAPAPYVSLSVPMLRKCTAYRSKVLHWFRRHFNYYGVGR